MNYLLPEGLFVVHSLAQQWLKYAMAVLKLNDIILYVASAL